MSALDKIRRGKRLTADFLYELLYGIANGDLATQNNNLPYWRNKDFYDHVIEGCIWTGDSYGSTRLASMTAGLVMINGKVVSVDAIANRAFTASKDTYIDVDENGAISYSEVANNAASPSLAANSIRIAIVVTGASSIASAGSINQGEYNKMLPIASSVAYSVSDSLGNLICSRMPTPALIGYGALNGTQSVSSQVQITGASTSVVIPVGRTVMVYGQMASNSGAAIGANLVTWAGAIGGTTVGYSNIYMPTTGTTNQFSAIGYYRNTSSGSLSITFNLSGSASSSSMTVSNAFISVELV